MPKNNMETLTRLIRSMLLAAVSITIVLLLFFILQYLYDLVGIMNIWAFAVFVFTTLFFFVAFKK